jgi:DNA-binding NtrC family response regulator
MMSEKDLKILIVDDDPFVRDILAFILDAADYAVVTAENGFEAFELCSSDPGIGLLVSDINMPVMSGLDLTKELRKHQVEIPIVVLTGDGGVAAARDALACGASEYIIKDESIQDTILSAVEKALESDRSRRQAIV